MAAKLIVEEGDLEGFVLTFDEGSEWIIGRDPDEAQLVVEDASVSRSHARCRLEEQGYYLENLSETNPIEVNGEPLTEPALLKQGDTVTLGSQIFRFYQETSAQLIEEELPSPKEDPSAEETPKQEIEEEMETSHESLFEEDSGGGTALAEINFDLLESGRWLLKVVGGPNNGAEFSMQSGREYLIGTDPSACDIVFHDTSVSRQHARLMINDDDTLTIEDLSSRNGTLIDGQKIEANQPLETNTIVSMGTTVFVIYDREGEMQTIISPLMPSIVNVLKEDKEETKEGEETTAKVGREEEPTTKQKPMTGLILLGVVAGLFVLGGLGIANLFTPTKPVKQEGINSAPDVLQKIFSRYNGLKYSYNKNTGSLLIVGHVLTNSQKQELTYSLQGQPFIHSIDDSGVIIDEFIWQEMNQVLARNPEWKGVSVSTPEPGRFVMTGYLKTRRAADNLLSYVGINFPYISGIEKRLIVEEDITEQLKTVLRADALNDVKVRMENGELIFTGTVATESAADFDQIIAEAKEIDGVRAVKSFVSEITAQRGVLDISDEYEVTGTSTFGGKMSVVVNGRILTTGDVLDGRTITKVAPNEIMLKDNRGKQYRISF